MALYERKLVVSYLWLTVHNLDQLYVLVSSAHKTSNRDMTDTVLKVILKTQITELSLFIVSHKRI